MQCAHSWVSGSFKQFVWPVKYANLTHVLHQQMMTFFTSLWGPYSLWMSSPNFSIKGRLNNLHHIARSLKVMACDGDCSFSVLLGGHFTTYLWWQSEYLGLYFGITMDKGLISCSKGLRQFHDIWEGMDLRWEGNVYQTFPCRLSFMGTISKSIVGSQYFYP